jgi:hypothetical protein
MNIWELPDIRSRNYNTMLCAVRPRFGDDRISGLGVSDVVASQSRDHHGISLSRQYVCPGRALSFNMPERCSETQAERAGRSYISDLQILSNEYTTALIPDLVEYLLLLYLNGQNGFYRASS